MATLDALRQVMSRVGLVTTFRFVPFMPHDGGQEAIDRFERCWSTLESFLLFHLAKGVEHVFLYADANDGSNDSYIGSLRLYGWRLMCAIGVPECTLL